MASTSQRRRQLARERWERQQARRANAVHRQRRRRKAALVTIAIVAVVALVGVLGSLGSWGSWWLPSDDDVTATADDTAPSEPAAASGDCTYTATEGSDSGPGLPPAEPVPASTATITLNGSPVTMELLADDAPCTVGSLIHLAGNDFYDGTTCHRLTTSDTLKVLQCGDPTGSGGGGPGYEYGLENTEGATYPAGTVAMARRGDDPNSNGSQFFLVYGDSQLPPDYTVFGRITEGLDVLTAIAAEGTSDGSDDAQPAAPVTVDDLVTGA